MPSSVNDPGRGWHNRGMAARGKDETPDERPPVRGPEVDPDVLDLWSPPPTALNLDASDLWGDDALDRLAAVLPILGEDVDATPGLGLSPPINQAKDHDLTRGGDLAAGRDLPAAAHPVGAGAGGDVGVDVGVDVGGDVGGGRPARRQEFGTGRVRGLSVAGIVVLLVAVYSISVALAMVWRSNLVTGDPAEQRRVRIVTDGPLPCPMYWVAEQGAASAAPAGSCFFVG